MSLLTALLENFTFHCIAKTSMFIAVWVTFHGTFAERHFSLICTRTSLITTLSKFFFSMYCWSHFCTIDYWRMSLFTAMLESLFSVYKNVSFHCTDEKHLFSMHCGETVDYHCPEGDRHSSLHCSGLCHHFNASSPLVITFRPLHFPTVRFPRHPLLPYLQHRYILLVLHWFSLT